MTFEVPQNGPLRLVILEKSIRLESLLNDMLKSIFKMSRSKTLNDGGSTLPFPFKVDLLYDLDYLDKEAYGKFQLFIPIRNHFVHWDEATNFTSVLEVLDKELRDKFFQLNLLDEWKSRKEIAQKHNLQDVEINPAFLNSYSELREKFVANDTKDLSSDQVELFYYHQWVLLESNLSTLTVKLYERSIKGIKTDVTKSLTLDDMCGMFKSAVHIAILEGEGNIDVSRRKDMLLIHEYNKTLAKLVDNAFEKTKSDIQRIFDERLNETRS